MNVKITSSVGWFFLFGMVCGLEFCDFVTEVKCCCLWRSGRMFGSGMQR